MMVSLVSSSVETWKVGVLLAEALEGLAELVGVVAAHRLDGHLDHRVGDVDVLQRAVVGLRAVGVAAGAVDAHHRDDVARLGGIDLLALLGVHLDDAAEAFLLARALVVVLLALADRALVDPGVGELPVLVVDDLERHADERLLGVVLQRDLLRLVVGVRAVVLDVQRRGQVAGHGVQQGPARPCS